MSRLFIELYLDEEVNVLPAGHPPYEFVRRPMRILNQVTADEMEGQVRYI